ncbi:hypothetical protein ABES67_05170 [Priestia megaterium]
MNTPIPFVESKLLYREDYYTLKRGRKKDAMLISPFPTPYK